jgi:hypothetical protein
VVCLDGTKIQSKIYNNIPVPKHKTSVTKNRRHAHDGMGELSPKPPQTPPIHLSVSDFVKFRSQFFSVIFFLPHNLMGFNPDLQVIF